MWTGESGVDGERDVDKHLTKSTNIRGLFRPERADSCEVLDP